MRGAVTAAAATTVSGSSFDPADHHLSPLMHPATTATSKYARQPRDAKEGLSQAIRSLHRNVSAAARVVAVPMQAMERDGATGAVRAVLRAVPVAVLRPMMGATEAVGAALMGIRNDLDPMRRGEVLDKYKDAPVG
ncbi:ATG C terminal domain-containing protein [Blastocladiella britannica]|nr:ATG C terminal domain-containing protein [Blastocladiella britannica]